MSDTTVPNVDFSSLNPVNSMAPSPTLPAGGGVPTSNAAEIQNILAGIGTAVAPTAPMYNKVGAVSQPNIEGVLKPMREMQDTQVRPWANTRYAERNAVQRSNLAQITNTINQYANEQKRKENASLTKNIQDVMMGQERIQQAQTVLSDPSATPEQKKAAQDVISSNKEMINGKFQDKKLFKQMQKAFDISFTDPSKNNTPEIAAGKEADAKAKEASSHGLTPNTPAEKLISDSFNGKAFVPPAQNTQAPVNTPATQATGQRSATPYADQFLAKQPQELQANPLYAAQLKQYQDQQNKITQYVIPKLLDAASRQQIEGLKQEGANARAQLKSYTDYTVAQDKITAALKINDEKMKGAWNRMVANNKAAMARTEVRVRAAKDIANNKQAGAQGVKGELVYAKMINEIDTNINQRIQQNDALQKQLDVIDKIKPSKQTDQQKEFLAFGKEAIDSNKEFIKQQQVLSRQVRDDLTIYRTNQFGNVTGATGITGMPSAGDNTDDSNKSLDGLLFGGDSDAESGSEESANEFIDNL